MWAIARYDLGLTDEEFGRLTPVLFELLVERKAQQTKLQYVFAGIVASAVINFSMCHPEKPANVVDFIPQQYLSKDDVVNTDLSTMTPEEVGTYLRNQFSKKTFRRR